MSFSHVNIKWKIFNGGSFSIWKFKILEGCIEIYIWIPWIDAKGSNSLRRQRVKNPWHICMDQDYTVDICDAVFYVNISSSVLHGLHFVCPTRSLFVWECALCINLVYLNFFSEGRHRNTTFSYPSLSLSVTGSGITIATLSRE